MTVCQCLVNAVSWCVAVVLFSGTSWAQDGDSLLERLAQYEQRMETAQAAFKVIIPEENATFLDMKWGYRAGKEYLDGIIRTKPFTPDGDPVDTEFRAAFDGERLRIFRRGVGSDRASGRITWFEPDELRTLSNVRTLLGYDIKSDGRHSPSQALGKAESILVTAGVEDAGRAGLLLVEVTRIEDHPEVRHAPKYDARLWLDPEKDYAIVKYEKYFSLEGNRKYKALVYRVNDIRHEKIEGVWFPVFGKFQAFSPEYQVPTGYTREELESMSPENAEALLEIVPTPMVAVREVHVEPTSVRIGHDIDDATFTIEYPHGAVIYDEFLRTHYTVGAHTDIDGAVEPLESQMLSAEAPERSLAEQAEDSTAVATAVPRVSQDGDGVSRDFPWGGGVLAVGGLAICMLLLVLYRKSNGRS
jgi:hypothetical protein